MSRSRSAFPVTTQSYCGTDTSSSIAMLANAVALVPPQVIVEPVSPELRKHVSIPVVGVA